MRLVPQPLEIAEDEGFTRDRDLFGRKPIADGLTNLVTQVRDPLVVALDGQWGSGKSTFLKMWAGELRRAGFPVVYFDAFENDYSDDPFIAIAGEIIALAQERRAENDGRAKAFTAKAIDAAKILGRVGLRIGTRLGTAGVLDETAFEAIADGLGEELSGAVDKHLGERLTKRREEKATIQQFRDALRELPSLLSSQSEPPEAGTEPRIKPLVFIIDELDRCRPSFALEILERIKHFFSVPDVHFVLGVHLEELQNAVAAAYGPNFDARGYLQKFVQLRLTLESTDTRYEGSPSAVYVEKLAKDMQLAADADWIGHAVRLISHVATHRSLSLRTIERILSVVALGLSVTNAQMFRPPPIVVGLSILKVIEPTLYNEVKHGRSDFETVRNALRLGAHENHQHEVRWAERFFRFALDPSWEGEEADRMAESLWRWNIGFRAEIVTRVAGQIVDRIAPLGG